MTNRIPRSLSHLRPAVPWRETLVAAVIVGASAALTIGVGHGSAGSAVGSDAGVLPEAGWETFTTILLRNSAVALGLFSGAVTLGITTGVFLLLVGGMLGWSMAISAAALGVAETLLRSWAYTPLELAGFVLAGAAGLIPLFAVVGRATGNTAARGESLPRALRTFVVALSVLVLAAGVETASIGWTALRTGIV
ncbi:stage II sporulation protein M [Micropruina sp.]|uniref:stage II sporulation protein M n=1 Tax=Micropruina sp. TaxID=2737536 RepID=UPI0039E32AB9